MSYQYILVTANIFTIDAPLLLGLHALTQAKVAINFADYIMMATNGSWLVNHVREPGDLCVVWDRDVFFTEVKIRKLYRHFYHSSDETLMASICCASQKHYISDTRSTISRGRDFSTVFSVMHINHTFSTYGCLRTIMC